MKKLMSFGCLMALGLLGCGAAEGPDRLSFEEFRDQAYQDPETGTYIVNGDELAEDESALKVAYQSFLASFDAAQSGLKSTEQGLIVNRVGGRDDKWASATAANLTYCISSSSFGTRYSTVVNAMNSATAAWEGTARVNFVHSSSLDGSCSRTTSGVVFNVRLVNSGGQFLASAFFPSNSRRSREVQIDTTAFGSISPYTLTGILRHELGHTLGFRHEHTRPEAGTCFEDNNWRSLTTYDSASVMHYPQCNGSNRSDLVLTSRDQSGARALYP
jgi:serralysin